MDAAVAEVEAEVASSVARIAKAARSAEADAGMAAARTGAARTGATGDVAPLVCRAFGGLSDSLNQLYRCAVYAASAAGCGRRVVWELTFFGATDLSAVLESSPVTPPPVPIVLSSAAAVRTLVAAYGDERTVPPKPLSAAWSAAEKRLVPTCTLSAAYPRDTLMVWNSDGNAQRAFDALKWLRLTPSAADAFAAARATLPTSYAAVQARHTDFQSDEGTIYGSLAALAATHTHVVLFTDSLKLRTAVTARCPAVLHSPMPLRSDAPQHTAHGNAIPTLLLEALIDVCLCASATTLVTTHATSGFSVLAKQLHAHPDALANFARSTSL
jgi:hypothetical protein